MGIVITEEFLKKQAIKRLYRLFKSNRYSVADKKKINDEIIKRLQKGEKDGSSN